MNATKTMAKKRGTKSALLTSLLSLLLCVTMLIGTTFAWFTDSVTSGENQIIAGNLDVDAEYSKDGTTWASLQGSDSLFSQSLWEPGHTEVVYIKVVNKGTLAFNYSLKVSPVSETSGISVVNDAEFKLSDYLKFGTTTLSYTAVTKYADRDAARADATLQGMQQSNLEKAGVLYSKSDSNAENAAKSEAYTALVVYMPETVGNEANYKTGTTPPQINLGVTVYAWQEDYENDSFGNDYDILDDTTTNSYSTGWSGESAITPVSTTGEDENKQVDDTTLSVTDKNTNTERASAYVPKETKYEDENGIKHNLSVDDKLQLTVDLVLTDDDGDITVESGSSATTYDVSLLRVVETAESDGTTTTTNKVVASAGYPIKVALDIGVVELQKFYHKGNELTAVDTLDDVNELGEYYYDVATGKITFMTDSFSNYTSVYRFAGGLGTEQYPYQIATAGHWNEMYQCMYDADDLPYFKLINDIDFAGKAIQNYAYKDGSIVYNMWSYLDLNGAGYTVKNIENFEGYGQIFPYLYNDSSIHNITFDYQIENEARTIALCYSTHGECYFTDVKTTGQIVTSADWATAFVAYTSYSNSNIYYTRCTNYANIKASFGSNGYVAPFGSHNGGGVHITFDNCANYGTIMGRNVGFVGMGNDSAYTFKDAQAVCNYGTMFATGSCGYFNYSSEANSKTIGDVTCQVKGDGASLNKSSKHTNQLPENFGDEIYITEVSGASYYEVQFSFSIGAYNYAGSGSWGGGFPRSYSHTFSASDVVKGKIDSGLVKGYVLEEKQDAYNGYNSTKPTYDGMFIPDDFDWDSATVTQLTDDIALVKSGNKAFYKYEDPGYPTWFTLLTTSAQNNKDTQGLSVTLSVTAYNTDGSVLSVATNSYQFTATSAINYLSE